MSSTAQSWVAKASYLKEPISEASSLEELYAKIKNHPNPEFVSIYFKTVTYETHEEYLNRTRK